ncbi:MAG: hypothetical protein LBF33_02875 [Oscillospiraceae bacterium]|nr:hypothetical protein [Oscillospiraceae bacterium]
MALASVFVLIGTRAEFSPFLRSAEAGRYFEANVDMIQCRNGWSFPIPVYDDENFWFLAGSIASGAGFKIKHIDIEREVITTDWNGKIPLKFLCISGLKAKLSPGSGSVFVYKLNNYTKPRLEPFDLVFVEEVGFEGYVEIMGFSGDFAVISGDDKAHMYYVKLKDFDLNSFVLTSAESDGLSGDGLGDEFVDAPPLVIPDGESVGHASDIGVGGVSALDLGKIKWIAGYKKTANFWSFPIPVYDNWYWKEGEVWSLPPNEEFIVYKVEGEKVFISRDLRYFIPRKFFADLDNIIGITTPGRLDIFVIDAYWKNFELEERDLVFSATYDFAKVFVLGEFTCKDTGKVFYTIMLNEDRGQTYFAEKTVVDGLFAELRSAVAGEVMDDGEFFDEPAGYSEGVEDRSRVKSVETPTQEEEDEALDQKREDEVAVPLAVGPPEGGSVLRPSDDAGGVDAPFVLVDEPLDLGMAPAVTVLPQDGSSVVDIVSAESGDSDS